MATTETVRVFRGGRHAADRRLKFEDGVLHDDKRSLSYVVLNPPQIIEGGGLFGGTKRVFHASDETGTTFEAPEVQAFLRELALKMGVTLDPAVKLAGVTFEAPDVAVGSNGEPVQVSFQGKLHDWDSNVAHAVTRWTILKAMKAKMKQSWQQLLGYAGIGLAVGIILLLLVLAYTSSKGGTHLGMVPHAVGVAGLALFGPRGGKNGNGKTASPDDPLVRPWGSMTPMEAPVQFEVLDEMPENGSGIMEDKDVNRMREATSPKDFRMAGVVDKALTDDFATLHAIAGALEGAADPLMDYIESYYRMTASEGGRGRNDMVAVGRQHHVPDDAQRRSIFRFGGGSGGQ